eukprot:s3379_g3.t1
MLWKFFLLSCTTPSSILNLDDCGGFYTTNLQASTESRTIGLVPACAYSEQKKGKLDDRADAWSDRRFTCDTFIEPELQGLESYTSLLKINFKKPKAKAKAKAEAKSKSSPKKNSTQRPEVPKHPAAKSKSKALEKPAAMKRPVANQVTKVPKHPAAKSKSKALKKPAAMKRPVANQVTKVPKHPAAKSKSKTLEKPAAMKRPSGQQVTERDGQMARPCPRRLSRGQLPLIGKKSMLEFFCQVRKEEDNRQGTWLSQRMP